MGLFRSRDAPSGSCATLWATPLERAADVRTGRLDIRMLVAALTSFGLVERAIDRVPPSTFPPARPHGSKLLEHTGDPMPICVDCKRRAGPGIGAALGNVLVDDLDAECRREDGRVLDHVVPRHARSAQRVRAA